MNLPLSNNAATVPPFLKSDIFRIAGVSKTGGNAIVKDYPRTFHANPFIDENARPKEELDRGRCR